MKVNLQLKTSQHLALTPQLQQSIRLLQLSTQELDQELETFLMQNPLLERDDSPNEEAEPAHFDSWSPDGLPGPSWHDGDDETEAPQSAAPPQSLTDHLVTQLRLMPLNERDNDLILALVAQLDEAGYLPTTLEAIQTEFPESLAVTVEELQVALCLLQSLDPPGVGARSLAECLTLQLKALPADTEGREPARQIVRNHLDLLAGRDFSRLRKLLGISEPLLQTACQLVTRLNPKPGLDFSPLETRYVVPDVLVRKVRGQWTASLNPEAMPRLRINALYAQLMHRDRESAHPLSSQLQEARWLIRNVQQRFDTILRVSQAIIVRQHAFLDHGEVAMRPLVLREIADELELHESTISRVTTQKYMLTPRGLYELKYFFSSHVSTDTGGAVSSTAIRALIRQIIQAEDGKNPLSDNRLSELLAEQGFKVARRTVAKYREALQIHPASQRKSL